MTETVNKTEAPAAKPAAKKRKLAFKRHYFAFPYFFLSAVFVVIPLIILFVYAFRGADGGFTFSNFGSFFQADVLSKLGNSLLVALATTAVCLILAYPIALILANSKFNKSMILVLLFILPMYINSMLRTYALKSVYDMVGMKNAFLKIVVAHVYDFFPFMLLPIYTVLVNMDKSYLEASTDLGANPLRTFARVTLPLSVPGIVSGILMVFMPTVSTFAIRDIVEKKEFVLFGNAISDKFDSRLYGAGAAYAMILLAMVMVTMLVSSRLSARRQRLAGGVK